MNAQALVRMRSLYVCVSPVYALKCNKHEPTIYRLSYFSFSSSLHILFVQQTLALAQNHCLAALQVTTILCQSCCKTHSHILTYVYVYMYMYVERHSFTRRKFLPLA